ncbi:hypothetical protein P3L10_003195 [Capsicum annuum]|uniref:uncharacterized protein LOC107845502 n=1 Tax=Capsicum annuum TaxID=4072 RepID=UPI0007BFE882|nr:uncharacterized protein LOC107845502 [Capsicum annuum]
MPAAAGEAAIAATATLIPSPRWSVAAQHKPVICLALVSPQPATVRLILCSSVSAFCGRKLTTEFAPFARGGDRTPDLLLKRHSAEPLCQLWWFSELTFGGEGDWPRP